MLQFCGQKGQVSRTRLKPPHGPGHGGGAGDTGPGLAGKAPHRAPPAPGSSGPCDGRKGRRGGCQPASLSGSACSQTSQAMKQMLGLLKVLRGPGRIPRVGPEAGPKQTCFWKLTVKPVPSLVPRTGSRCPARALPGLSLESPLPGPLSPPRLLRELLGPGLGDAGRACLQLVFIPCCGLSCREAENLLDK